ncbi:hypothetical protein D9613_010361 [Agrocybe pediades]|uniref:Uncharacterized protein n=1 Tax=Agrocybe pediades TaxID=84607 RepID=A0A8H4VJI0_9AGAR|nr:hypothetical protein D9613_010361 [Agrocybe pediades]
MADPLSITLAAITLGTALKDLTELALKLHESFKKHAHNMRTAESLAADTVEIVQDIEKFYIARGDILDNLPDVRHAVARLSRDMQSVYDQCLPILHLANSPERGLRRALLKIEQWRNRKEVESNVRNLRDQANKCYRRFTRHTQLGTAVAIGELKASVSEGFSATTRQLSTLQVSDNNVLAFMGSTRAVLSTLPPDVILSKDLVFKLYVRGHVGKIDDILKNLASKHSYAVEEPDDWHSRPPNPCSVLPPRTSEAVDYVRDNTVTELIRVQQGLWNVEAGGNSIQKGAWALRKLAIDLMDLEMYSESLILCTWTVDLYKTLSKSHRDVYGPHLALAFFDLACTSYDTGDFAQAMVMTTECLSLLETCAPTFATEELMARALSYSAHSKCAIGEDSSASLQDADNSVAMFERLGVGQTAVIGPQQGGNYTTFGLLIGGDWLIYHYVYALDAQQELLYDSERYHEALDVGERALQVYRRLAQCYKHVDIESEVATHCHFLCNDVFRDVIPLSSALNYAQEAVQIWEEVHEITRADEEHILDSLATQTKILVEMGRPSDALTVFQKLERRVRTMATNQRMYIHKMQDLASRLHSKKHYAEAATASRTIVEICRQAPDSLSTSHRFLINILLDHIMHCHQANYLSEALIYSQEALAVAGQEHLKDAAFIDQYLLCINWAGYMSLEAGYPQQAINQCQVALNIDSSSFGYNARKTILWTIYRKALAFLRLGRLSLAAATITEGYDFSESTKHNLQAEDSYGWLLYVSALVHRCAGKQDDALTAIKAAISTFESCDRDRQSATLSDVQADMGYDAEGLCTAEENVQLTEKYASSSSPLDRNLYRTSQYSLCLRLFFNGEFTRARQLIVEVRNFYEWHAHSRNKWFIYLARALRAEGILECASDRHAEGAGARTKLNELQQRLRATLPGVADQVDVHLNYERNYPAWKRLREKYPLTCSHWVEEEAITGQEYTITHSILPPSLHPTSSLTPGGHDSRNI